MKKFLSFLLILSVFAYLPVYAEAKKKSKIATILEEDRKKRATTTEEKKVAVVPVINKNQDARTIFGDSLVTQEQAVAFIKKTNPNAKLNCNIEEIVRLYFKEAQAEGIRPDVALSQALLETGFFRYGGDVKPYQNNFCGLGSVGGGAKGASFQTPELGVRAHIQHILAYSSKRAPKYPIVDPRYNLVKSKPQYFGTSKTWTDLNGRWAAKGVPYGERILDIHNRLLKTEAKGSVIEPKFDKDVEIVKPDNQKKTGKKSGGIRDRIKTILEDKK